MNTLKTALVGLGRAGWRHHLPELHEHPGFNLTAVIDPLPERLEEARDGYGVEGFSNIEEMLEVSVPDLLVIASPTQFHREQILHAFRRGCNVFCDKPLVTNYTETKEIVEAMRATERKLMVFQPRRTTPELEVLQQILAQDLLGEIYMIKRGVSHYVRRNDWQAFSEHGGGMLNNYGAHYVDQLLYLTGSPAKKISCSLRTIASLGDADDVVKILIETENAIILDLDINMAAPYPLESWMILGSRGSAVLRDDRWDIKYYTTKDIQGIELQKELAARDRKYPSGEDIPWQEASFQLPAESGIRYYDKCYEYFAEGKEPFVPIEETAELMRVLSVCRKEASTQSGISTF